MRWIRPQDELPELKNHNEFGQSFSDDVLIYYNGGYYPAYLYLPDADDPEDRFWMTYDSRLEIEIEDVICWAPIAPPPKEWLDDEEEPPA